VETVDVNFDGALNFPEFRKVIDKFTGEETATAELHEAFKVFDKVGCTVICFPTMRLRCTWPLLDGRIAMAS